MSVQTASWSDRVTLPADVASVAVARGFIQDLLVEHDLLYLVVDARLVASEFASNAVRHAKTPFTVTLEGLPDSVRLTVRDESSSRTMRSGIGATAATAGRGLSVVGAYARAWGVTHEKNTNSVWASFALRKGNEVSPRRGARSQISTATLSSLLNDVKSARADVQATRASGVAGGVREGQAQLAAALGFYVEALASRHLPVPYLLRDELRLYGRATAAYNTAAPWRGRA